MKKLVISIGIISAIFHYEIKDDVAYIKALWLGCANAVEFPLTDKWDANNFCKLLSNNIGMEVEVA